MTRRDPFFPPGFVLLALILILIVVLPVLL